MAKCGASVAINYNSNLRLAKNTLKSVKSFGVNGEIIKANVSKEKEVKYLIRKTEKKLGPINLLITNAGILHVPKILIMLYGKKLCLQMWMELSYLLKRLFQE